MTSRAHSFRWPIAIALALGVEPATPASHADPPPADSRALPAPERGGGPALFEVIAARRSVRELGSRAPTDAQLGQLLWAAQGITDDEGRRAAPSAGALYPLTLRVVDARGVWRYVPADHALVREQGGDHRAALAAAAFGQDAVGDAPTIVVITARAAITARKYGKRAPRYVALEAGHAAQGFLLAAAALELATVPVGAFDDDDLRTALDLDDDVTPLYLVPVAQTDSR